MRKTPTAPSPEDLIAEFTAASIQLFRWYDEDRAIISHKGYTCPTAQGAHGMTMLRTALSKAQRISEK